MCNVFELVVSSRAFMSSACAFVALALVSASAADAQTTDAVGVRAQGLAGAFTAVADDASAGFWNPAGIAGGPLVNGLFEYSKPDRTVDETVRGVAAAYPALGVTYYRLPISQIRTSSSTATATFRRSPIPTAAPAAPPRSRVRARAWAAPQPIRSAAASCSRRPAP